MTTALARVRKLWPWRGPKRHELAIGAGILGIIAGAPHWGAYTIAGAVWLAHRLREVRVGTVDDLAAAAERLRHQIARERVHYRRALLVRSYRLAERVHERRFGAHDRRTIACKILSAQAQLHTRFDEQHGVDVPALVDAIGHADGKVFGYGLALLLQFESNERFCLDGSYFERLWAALVDNREGRIAAAHAYATRLMEYGEVEDARAILLRASEMLAASASPSGSPFRQNPIEDAATRRKLDLAIAEGWLAQGEFERAWDLVAGTRHDAKGSELVALTGIAFNAGHVLWSCTTSRRLAYAATGEQRAALLLSLVSRLHDAMAFDAARAFLADVSASACTGELAQRRTILAALLGDGDASSTWWAQEPWRSLECDAELALRRGDAISAESHAQAALFNAIEAHGADNPWVSDALQLLARAVCLAGRPEEAVARLREGIAIVEARCGPEHPQLLRMLVPLAVMLPDGSERAAVRIRIEELRSLHRFDEIDAMRPPSA